MDNSGSSGHVLVIGDVANVGISAEALDEACAGARVSRTVLRSEVLRIVRSEPLDLLITSSTAGLLASEEFRAAVTARSGQASPMALLIAARSPDPAALLELRRAGLRAEYLRWPCDADGLREQLQAALRPYTPIPEATIETATRGPPGRAAAPEAINEHNSKRGERHMANITKTLEEAMKIDGAIAVALADWDSGLCLGTAGGGTRLNIEVAAAGNCQVVKAKMATMSELGIKGAIHDILITLDDQVHLIRPLRKGDSLFLYVAIDKLKGNLGMARHRLQKLESELNI